MKLFKSRLYSLLALVLLLSLLLSSNVFAEFASEDWNPELLRPDAAEMPSFERLPVPEVAGYDELLKQLSVQTLDRNRILLKQRAFDPLQENAPHFLSNHLSAQTLHPEVLRRIEKLSPHHVRLVQLKETVTSDTADELRDAGLNVIAYIPNNAFLVSGNDAALPAMLKNQIRWSGPIDPGLKIDETLQQDLSTGIEDAEALIRVSGYRGETIDGWEELALTLGAGEVLAAEEKPFPSLLLRVERERMAEVTVGMAQLSGVERVQRFELPVTKNHGSIWLLQSGDPDTQLTSIFDAGINGWGQVYAAADSGLDTDGCQFRYNEEEGSQTFAQDLRPPSTSISNPDDKVMAYYVLPGSDAYDETTGGYHGTMTTGCAVGDNYQNLATPYSPGIDYSDGMAPGARVVFQDVGDMRGNLWGLALSTEFQISLQAYDSGARVHNDSYGSERVYNGYDISSQMLDLFLWQYPDYNIFFAAGNSGPDESTLGGGGGTAKNTVSVGASTPAWFQDGRDIVSFSSRGPTEDGRLKPDIMAPGVIISATESGSKAIPGVTNVYDEPARESQTVPPNNNCKTAMTSGTSFSSPTAAGMGLLVRQYFTDGFYPSGVRVAEDSMIPSNALVKAVMINSGRNLDGSVVVFYGHSSRPLSGIEPVPSTNQGWGRVTLEDALYFKGDRRDLVVLADIPNGSDDCPRQGDEVRYEIDVKRDMPLKISLVWADPPASPYAGVSLVNNLDLEVISPSGVRYFGNINYSNGYSTPAQIGDTFDTLNNFEQVIIENPSNGVYTVVVHAASLPGNGENDPFDATLQGYALIVTGNRGDISDIAGPRIGIRDIQLSGGCDNDDALDLNERAAFLVSVSNSGDGDAQGLYGTLTLNEDLTEIDSSLIAISGESRFEIGNIDNKTQRTFTTANIRLSAEAVDACNKYAAFDLKIFDANDELLQSSTFRVPLARNITVLETIECQDDLCNPPPEITEITPNSLFAGIQGVSLEVRGERIADDMTVEFDPDVLNCESLDFRSTRELRLRNCTVPEDTEPGDVALLLIDSDGFPTRYENMLKITEAPEPDPVTDGDIEAEIITGADTDETDDGGGCRNAGSSSSSIVLLLAVTLLFYRRSRRLV